jgi:hypothetical protein
MSETGLTDKVPSSSSFIRRRDAAKTSGVFVLRATTDFPLIHTCTVPLGVDEFEVPVEGVDAEPLALVVPPFVFAAVFPGAAVVSEPPVVLEGAPELFVELAVEEAGQFVGF